MTEVLQQHSEMPWAPTFGEKLVGIGFNPSGDARILKAKQLCAELADLLEQERIESIQSGGYAALKQMITENAFSEILNAQMNVVKALTFNK